MSNRGVDLFLTNRGTGEIELIDDHLSHGEWGEGRSPSEAAPRIRPGETKHIQSAEGGDIPIIGQVMTGNEGWVLFRTTVLADFGAEVAWVRIGWNLPYFSFSSKGVGVWLDATRDDPRIKMGPSSFDDRDKFPSAARIAITKGGQSGDSILDAWPVLFPPFILLETNLGVNVNFDFLNTCEPERTVIPPFSNGAATKSIPEPIIHTNPAQWNGTWSGDRITARIASQADGSLMVRIVERRDGKEIRQSPQSVTIQRIFVIPPVRTVNPDGDGSSGTMFRPSIAVQRHVGTPRRESEILTLGNRPPVLLQSGNLELVHGLMNDRIQLGSDHIEVEPDAVIDMYRMVADGEWVDTTLRYRRPASGQILVTTPRIDELLYFYPDVN